MYCVDMRGIGWLNLHGVNIYKPFRIKPSVCLEVPVRIGTENKQEVFVMKNVLQDEFHGFCMALADSVPGVSGGTVAFIMGFYDMGLYQGISSENGERIL